MQTYYLSAVSTSSDYVRVAVTATAPPNGDVVKFAFVDIDSRSTQPVTGDWVTGTWEPTQLPTGEWVARCLIGAGGKVLPVGMYAVWVWVVDSPTVPVKPVSTITIQ